MTTQTMSLSARMREDIRSNILALAAPDAMSCGEFLWEAGLLPDTLTDAQKQQRIDMMMDVWREAIVTVRWVGEKQ